MARKTESPAKPESTKANSEERKVAPAAQFSGEGPATPPDGAASLNAGNGAATTPPVAQDASDQFEQVDVEQPMQRVVRVVSKPEFFRRAGREFSRIPVDIRLDELEDGEVGLLLGEPMLSVSFGFLED